MQSKKGLGLPLQLYQHSASRPRLLSPPFSPETSQDSTVAEQGIFLSPKEKHRHPDNSFIGEGSGDSSRYTQRNNYKLNSIQTHIS